MSKYRLRVCSQAKEIAAHSSLCFVFGLDRMFDIKLKECCLLFMQIFRETCSKGKASKAQKKEKQTKTRTFRLHFSCRWFVQWYLHPMTKHLIVEKLVCTNRLIEYNLNLNSLAMKIESPLQHQQQLLWNCAHVDFWTSLWTCDGLILRLKFLGSRSLSKIDKIQPQCVYNVNECLWNGFISRRYPKIRSKIRSMPSSVNTLDSRTSLSILPSKRKLMSWLMCASLTISLITTIDINSHLVNAEYHHTHSNNDDVSHEFD